MIQLPERAHLTSKWRKVASIVLQAHHNWITWPRINCTSVSCPSRFCSPQGAICSWDCLFLLVFSKVWFSDSTAHNHGILGVHYRRKCSYYHIHETNSFTPQSHVPPTIVLHKSAKQEKSISQVFLAKNRCSWKLLKKWRLSTLAFYYYLQEASRREGYPKSKLT